MMLHFTQAAIHVGDPDWLWPAAALLLAALLILAWGYAQARRARGIILPALLKALGLAAIAAFLINPQWSTQRAQPRSNLFFTLIDNSQSLNVTDRDAAMSRAMALSQLLTGSTDGATPQAAEDGVSPWTLRLAESFDARRYFFDTRLHSLNHSTDLTFDGRGSSLATSLRTIADRYRGRPMAGIVLLTDGNATDLPETGEIDLTGLPPIYPVILGSDTPAADVGIANLTISQTAFEDAPVTVAADVSALAYKGKTIVGELLDESNKVVKSMTLEVDGDDKTLAFRFQVKPEKTGVAFYRLRVREQEASGSSTKTSPLIAEATTANNERLISVDRGRGPYRILYVSGRPNWEFKFLNRALAADPQVELVGLIRIARREAKFAWRDNVRDAANPLFRGFDPKDKEQVENYDEPVLVRINTLDDAELRSGFPKTAQDLAKYHALVIDDLEAAFFTQDQLDLIEKFVTQRSGGLMMLGGAESLREGDYHRTPIGRMLPVYLDRAAEAAPKEGGVKHRLELTRIGWLEPWVRLRGTEEEERKRLAQMPPFFTMNHIPTTGIKPGAMVLAEAVDEVTGTRWPALITQQFGGRVATMTLGDVWRWSLRREEGADDLTDESLKMWRQTMRWLVADVPGRVTATATQVKRESDSPKKLSVQVRDKEFKPLDNALVTITINGPKSEPIELRAEPSASQAGLYEASFLPREDGAYRATVLAKDDEAKEIGTQELGWTRGDSGDEWRSLKPNRALLESIAKRSGGQVIAAADLDSFAASLPTKQAPVMETLIEPLWHRWWALVLALGLLVGEWTVRRMRGLP